MSIEEKEFHKNLIRSQCGNLSQTLVNKYITRLILGKEEKIFYNDIDILKNYFY